MNVLKKFFFFHCNPGPRWASWNLGCFFCLTCAGIHRRLGTHISKVKSVTLDSWTPEQIEVRIAFYKILFFPPFRRSSLAESKSGSFLFRFFPLKSIQSKGNAYVNSVYDPDQIATALAPKAMMRKSFLSFFVFFLVPEILVVYLLFFLNFNKQWNGAVYS